MTDHTYSSLWADQPATLFEADRVGRAHPVTRDRHILPKWAIPRAIAKAAVTVGAYVPPSSTLVASSTAAPACPVKPLRSSSRDVCRPAPAVAWRSVAWWSSHHGRRGGSSLARRCRLRSAQLGAARCSGGSLRAARAAPAPADTPRRRSVC